MNDSRSRTCGSARGGAKVAHEANRAEQSEERAHGSWRTHAGTRATPEAKNDARGNRYWADGAIAGTGSRSKNHESEESTNCCGGAGTFRQGRREKVLNVDRSMNNVRGVGHLNRHLQRGMDHHPRVPLGPSWTGRRCRSFFSCESCSDDDDRHNLGI